MTHDSEEYEDSALRARLRAIDPAFDLSPADPDWSAGLMEETMTDIETDESRADGTHDRSPFTWLVAAAVVVLIATGLGFALVNRGDDGSGPVGDVAGSDAPASPGRSVTRLTVGAGAVAGRCMPPSAATIGRQDVAFDGVVTAISGGVVTLEPSTFFQGAQTDVVTVRSPSRDLQQLLSAVDFEEGQRYLVSATDGRVAVCGVSTEWSAARERLYEQAFAE